MPSTSRKDTIPKGVVAFCHCVCRHCVCRCVRQAFLFSHESQSGKDFSHRRFWVRDRLIELAACFGVEVWEFAQLCHLRPWPCV